MDKHRTAVQQRLKAYRALVEDTSAMLGDLLLDLDAALPLKWTQRLLGVHNRLREQLAADAA